MSADEWMVALVWSGMFCPVALVAVMALTAAAGRRLPEGVVGALTGIAMGLATVLFGLALGHRLSSPTTAVFLHFGDWFSAGDGAFTVRLLADEMSLSFAAGTPDRSPKNPKIPRCP